MGKVLEVKEVVEGVSVDRLVKGVGKDTVGLEGDALQELLVLSSPCAGGSVEEVREGEEGVPLVKVAPWVRVVME